MSSVRGRTAIVTGGANGIGFQYCCQLLHNGAKAVAILDLPNSNGEDAAGRLNEKFGEGRALFFTTDVANSEEFEAAFEKAVAALEGLDIMINNAGIMNDGQWRKTIDINVKGVIHGTLMAVEHMGKHKGGKGGVVVNISSMAGLRPFSSMPGYTASKFAVVGFTQALKDHYESTGVSMRVLCPGLCETSLIETSHGHYLDCIDSDKAIHRFTTYYAQPLEHPAKALIQLVEKGSNGTIYVTRDSEPAVEVELPNWDRRSNESK